MQLEKKNPLLNVNCSAIIFQYLLPQTDSYISTCLRQQHHKFFLVTLGKISFIFHLETPLTQVYYSIFTLSPLFQVICTPYQHVYKNRVTTLSHMLVNPEQKYICQNGLLVVNWAQIQKQSVAAIFDRGLSHSPCFGESHLLSFQPPVLCSCLFTLSESTTSGKP